MKCPECDRKYPSDEVMCDCGYIFEEEDRDTSDEETCSNDVEYKNGITIFVVLSSIITILVITFGYVILRSMPTNKPLLSLFIVLFTMGNIITLWDLIRLKNWARIAYIIINIIVALLTLLTFIFILSLSCSYGTLSIKYIIGALILLSPFFYSVIAIIYFLHPGKAKLFKQ
ncbi:MAG: hypothetical protein GY928_33595 [Colwellia sp.]|nr:hypothetical protein [Colwellia sp.]